LSRTILVINPNTSEASLAMMLGVARTVLPPGFTASGICAATGPSMIVSAEQLTAQASEVVRLGFSTNASAIIVAAFGDPGVAELRRMVTVPVTGIGEASIMEAQTRGRRFGIATTTPGLVASIAGLVEQLGLGSGFTGVRLAQGGPLALAADPAAQEQALAEAVCACVEQDGAEAVIIGGGPLSAAAAALGRRLSVDIIEPLPAAVRRIADLVKNG